MADDFKKDNRVPVYLTDQQMLDVSRECGRLDKKPSEYIRFALLQVMYGTVGRLPAERNESREHE